MSMNLFTSCEHGITVLSIKDGMTIQHGEAVRTFTWLELEAPCSRVTPNLVEEWFYMLHQKED